MKQYEEQSRLKRRNRGSAARSSALPSGPRLAVFRSNKGIYAQLIDDAPATHRGRLVAAAGRRRRDQQDRRAAKVGQLIAKRAKDKGIDRVVFDRGGYLYHGRVAALADGAREGGLTF